MTGSAKILLVVQLVHAVQCVSLLFQYLASCVEAMAGLSSEAVIPERKDDFAAEVTVWHQFRALVRLL